MSKPYRQRSHKSNVRETKPKKEHKPRHHKTTSQNKTAKPQNQKTKHCETAKTMKTTKNHKNRKPRKPKNHKTRKPQNQKTTKPENGTTQNPKTKQTKRAKLQKPRRSPNYGNAAHSSHTDDHTTYFIVFEAILLMRFDQIELSRGINIHHVEDADAFGQLHTLSIHTKREHLHNTKN